MHSGIIDNIHFVAGTWPLVANLPTLVFIHGSGGDMGLWHNQMSDFSTSFNTVAVDLPGHGESPRQSHTSMEAYAENIMAFIRLAGISKPVPCGLSIGGGVALQLLLDYPDEIFAGILVSTGARLRVAPKIFDSITNDYSAFVDSIRDMACSPKTHIDRLQPFIETMSQTPPEVTADDFRACNEFDVSARLSEINNPVLIISADEDQLTPPKYGAYLESNIAGAKQVVIPNAGHIVPLEKPELVNSALMQFVESLT